MYMYNGVFGCHTALVRVGVWVGWGGWGGGSTSAVFYKPGEGRMYMYNGVFGCHTARGCARVRACTRYSRRAVPCVCVCA
jgi:hypothetical protein